MDIKVGDVKKIIRESLGTSPEVVEESYIAQSKTYDLPTEFLSQKAKRAHFDKYHAVVSCLNKVAAGMGTVDASAANSDQSSYRSLKIDEIANLNSVYLHEMYFANVSDVHSEITMDTLPYMRLERDFGTFDNWQSQFIACAKSSRGGWAITGFSTYLQKFIVFFTDGDSAVIPVGVYPVLVLDMAEHAYYRDYQNDVDTYIRAMMKEIDWDVVEERVKRSEIIAKAMR